jgi:hypothetical protein
MAQGKGISTFSKIVEKDCWAERSTNKVDQSIDEFSLLELALFYLPLELSANAL